MSVYQLHIDGDCWPDTCPVRAQEVDDEGEEEAPDV